MSAPAATYVYIEAAMAGQVTFEAVWPGAGRGLASQRPVWPAGSGPAREKFWNAVFDYAKQRYELQDAIVIDKYTQICASAITQSNIKTVKRMENLLYLLNLDSIDTRVEMMRGKGGLFHEYALHSMSELYEIISERYQTVSYFGVEPEVIQKQIISKGLQGVDRIVPIGKTMDMDVYWDGFDIIRMLSRKIIVV